MKAMKSLIVMLIGFSLLLAASSAFAGSRYSNGGHYYGAYHHGKSVYVDRHVRGYAVAPRYGWGYYPAYPRVYAAPVYRGYCAPYPAPYAYAPAPFYGPTWSFGFSFGW
jgi:hypothetical protein